MSGGNVAVVDCGSNSTRLLICDPELQVLEREMRITRLSAGVDATRRLRDDALLRTQRVLEEFRGVIDGHDVRRGVVVATSAVRDAANRDEFVEMAEGATGLVVRVLRGDEEARFSYRGALHSLDASVPTMIVDIGGGSTELAVMVDDQLWSASMQLGCVRVTERALTSAPVTPQTQRLTRAMIDEELAVATSLIVPWDELIGQVRLVGLAGTVATLAQLEAATSHYDRTLIHHRVISREALRRWRRLLSAETPAERLQHPGMVSGREDVVVGGFYVLEAVMDRLGVDEVMASEDDILDGVAAALLADVHGDAGPATMEG